MGMLASSGRGRNGRNGWRCRGRGWGFGTAPEAPSSVAVLKRLAGGARRPQRFRPILCSLVWPQPGRRDLRVGGGVDDRCTLWKVRKGLRRGAPATQTVASQRQCSRHGSSWPRLTRAQARCVKCSHPVILSNRFARQAISLFLILTARCQTTRTDDPSCCKFPKTRYL